MGIRADGIFNTELPGCSQPKRHLLLREPLFKKVGEGTVVITVAHFRAYCGVVNLGEGSEGLGVVASCATRERLTSVLPLPLPREEAIAVPACDARGPVCVTAAITSELTLSGCA